MKKLLLTTIAIILLVHPSSAQVKFGIQGGLNINKFVMDTKVVESSNQAGFYVGPTFLIGCPVFDIEVAGIYDVRRGEVDGKSVKEQNVNVQANIRKALDINDNSQIFVFAGPQCAFNIDADDIDEVSDCVKDWRWKNSDFSVNLGGGVKINHVEIRVTYNSALGKTAEAEKIKDDLIERFKLKPKSNAWQIGLTYYF
jgi:hypothetical protein